MSIPAGTHLGPYEVLAPLGAGGMGEVYKARDPKLGREVALKVLPEEVSREPDRLARFEQEARAASALNHPNIITIYEIGQSGETSFIAMELVEGKTLRELAVSGPLPLRRVVSIAAQVAEGLAKAHAAGIVHRDLKPENLMVSKDGYVKILDFGLSKLVAPASGELSAMPTLARPETYPGTVLGTVAYMSPEQASGQAMDFRSDQFSLGSILYEVVTGEKAFSRKTAAETMSAIIRDEPETLAKLRPVVPLPLRWIVERCLAKDPEERYASTRDLARDLAAVRDHISEISSGAEAVVAAPVRASRRLVPLLAAAGLLAAGLFAGRVIWKGTPASFPSFKRLTYGRGPVWSARFAPDGQMIVYAASWDGAQKPQLYSVRAESPESLRLALPSGRVASVSKNGEMLILNLLQFSTGYASIGTLSQVPLSGSAPRDLLEDVGHADWSPDGSGMAVVRAPQWRYRLEFPAGKVLYETTGWISHPRISPKGDAVAFLDHPLFGDDRGNVAIVDRSGKKKTLSTGWESVQGVSWSASGEEIWFTATPAGNSRALYAVTRSGRQRGVANTPSGMTLQDISRDGRVLFVESNARVGFLGLLPGEAKERDLSGMEWSYGPMLSGDGKTAVFTEQGQAGGPGYSVYLRKMDGSAPVRLGEGYAMALSPDGKWVLTALIRTTPSQIVLLPTGAGEPKTFPKDEIEHVSGPFGAFFPDGKRIVFVGHEPGRPSRVFVQDLAGGAAKPVTPEGVVARLLSPDGTSLVTQTPEGLSLTPLEGGPSRPIAGVRPGDRPLRFAADGRSLFLRPEAREFPARVFRLDVSTGRREVWKELMPGDPAGITQLSPSAISEDGKTVLFTCSRSLSDLYLAEGLR